MKKIALVILLAIMSPICFSKTNGEAGEHKSIQHSNSNSEHFDLAKLTFKENIKSIYVEAGANAAPSDEKTLLGYERTESASPQFLIYSDLVLAGESDNMKNKVIFHYSEEGEILTMYELRIYSPSQNNHLLEAIQKKMGLPLITKLSTDFESGIKFKQAVWAQGSVIYLLLQELDKADVKTSNLAVFDNSNKDFYKLLGQKGYAIDPSALIEEALKQR